MFYVLVIAVSFLYVFCKGFQSLSAVFKKTLWVPPVSYAISFCEVFIISSVVGHTDTLAGSVWLALALGTGGWVGYLTSMYLHPKLTGKGW